MIGFLMVLSTLLIIISILPFFQNPHWVIRVAEFVKQQLLVLQVIVVGVTFLYIDEHPFLWYFQIAQILLIGYHIWLLAPYTRYWPRARTGNTLQSSRVVKMIFCNIYQFNTEYDRFIQLIENEKPDLFLTMESNGDWEKAMRKLEKNYPGYEKVTMENTYGMHFYTRMKVHKTQTHYFVSDDIPSIEAELETDDCHRFIFFGVHPPPPSPTEEENSKERDGDILSVARQVKDYSLPTIIAGDFNNVAWARSSRLFRKMSGLLDARIGHKMLSSFHAKYLFFRFPLDLLFHSTDIVVDKLFRYPSIGSDHFPIGCSFHICKKASMADEEVEELNEDEKEEAEEMIVAGQEEESDNRG